tara:strand:- start:519 stop:719 length:201 start_codon:yes stop_codon:yes gene_type:complete
VAKYEAKQMKTKSFKLPMEFKKYCKSTLVFLSSKLGFKKVYNQCLVHYGKEILNQSIKELKKEGKI